MDKQQVEQSIWTVHINSQLLFKKAVNGRTILLGMTAGENEKIDEIINKAIDDLAKVLARKTTRNEVTLENKQVTEVEDAQKVAVQEEKKQPATPRGVGGKFVSTKKTAVEESQATGSASINATQNEPTPASPPKKGFWSKLS